ncbi:MAG: hypothetical protein JW888_00280 [Pirellulales bacterium]|nr:hypothetical protein [Pirellulales bacterium]
MRDAADSDLFPLPLVVFEKYILLDHRPDYPMTYCLTFDFRGHFDRPALDDSLEEVLPRHPLFTARVKRLPWKGLCWISEGGSFPRIDWDTLDVPLACPHGEAIDLRRECGLRLWVRQDDGHARLTLQVHHACADGIGTLHFVGDLLAAYALRVNGHDNGRRLVPLDPASLQQRDKFDVELPEPVSQWHVLKSTVIETFKFLGRQPAPLVVPGTMPLSARDEQDVRGTPPRPFPGICSHTFDARKTEALRNEAKRRGVTLNDILLRDAFVALAEWNAIHDPKSRRRWLRINMPTNLRVRKDRRMPAANMMGYAFLTRHRAECDDSDELLEGIHRETELIKQWSLGLMFLDGLAFISRIPGLLRLTTRRRRCLASVVLSNLGDPALHFHTRLRNGDRRIQAGGVVFERLTGSPPVRPLTHAAVLASRHAGQLTVSLRCTPVLFSLADAEAFLAKYVEFLEKTAAPL